MVHNKEFPPNMQAELLFAHYFKLSPYPIFINHYLVYFKSLHDKQSNGSKHIKASTSKLQI